VSSIRNATKIPDRKTRARLAAFANVDERTVYRHIKGETRAHPLTVRAIHDAARALGIEIEARP